MEINIEKNQNLSDVYLKILETNQNEVVLHLPEGSPLFNRISNIRVLSKMCSDRGINLTLKTTDKRGNKMISEVFYENSGEVDFSRYEDSRDNLDQEETQDKVDSRTLEERSGDFGGTPKSPLLPKLPIFNLKSKFTSNTAVIVSSALGVLVVLISGFYFYLQTSLSADLEIFVTSERFVKSQNIRLSTTQNTDLANKILRGDTYKGSISITKEIPTTGEIKSGVKATGLVKVTNNSDSEVKLKKGEKFRFKKDNKEFLFLTTEEIELPARKLESTSPDVYVNLSKDVKVEAEDFGSNYNVEKGQGIKPVNYGSSVLTAEVSEAIKGGMKEDLKAVSEEDIKKIYQSAIEEIKSSFIPQSVEGKVFLKGSEQFSVQKTEYSHKINEETDTLKLTLIADALGLMYDKKEIENFMRSTFKDLIPAGYEIYGKELEVEANLLGKSSSSILTTTEGDLMVTVKTFVIPVLNTDSIKAKIAGQDLATVQSELENIPNIVNYNLNLSINVPFFSKLPADHNRLNVSIVRK